MIHENNPAHLADFVRLNEQWIREYFEIEDADRKLAADPAKIARNGGYVFTYEVEGRVIGAVALIRDDADNTELAKMAVDPAMRGQGIGRVLIEHAIRRAHAAGFKRVYLISNTKLTPALSLYRAVGFATVSEGQHPLYRRGNIVMELQLH